MITGKEASLFPRESKSSRRKHARLPPQQLHKIKQHPGRRRELRARELIAVLQPGVRRKPLAGSARLRLLAQQTVRLVFCQRSNYRAQLLVLFARLEEVEWSQGGS